MKNSRASRNLPHQPKEIAFLVWFRSSSSSPQGVPIFFSSDIVPPLLRSIAREFAPMRKGVSLGQRGVVAPAFGLLTRHEVMVLAARRRGSCGAILQCSLGATCYTLKALEEQALVNRTPSFAFANATVDVSPSFGRHGFDPSRGRRRIRISQRINSLQAERSRFSRARLHGLTPGALAGIKSSHFRDTLEVPRVC